MRNLQIALIGLLLIACGNENQEGQNQNDQASQETFPEKAKNMCIYEVNVRQYTPEGTFNAFATHLERLKDMGVDILWLMPIQPIGKEKRKGPLGSYYSVRDYRGINPEFGTKEDFQALVDKAHSLNMYVIIDWVPNHTAWDHKWISENPDYYVKDSTGQITMAHDWADVAQLNYDNKEMRKDMISEMKYWVENFGIDGFRQDHAGHEIPLDFWQDATEELNALKDLFWLAEWNTPEMHFAFHATYAWELHHLTSAVAKGEKNALDIQENIKKDLHRFGKYAFRMTFTSNHDENSWQGTVFERYGEGYKAMAVLMATIKGIPLIYSGQEAGLDKRLEFFEKDTIDWSELSLEKFYTQLLDLRKNNEALWTGRYGGQAEFVDTGNEQVIAYKRAKNGNQVMVVINLSQTRQPVTIEDDDFVFEDYFSDKQFDASSEKYLGAYEYYVGVVNQKP